jgi:hypothetical protein
VIAAEILSRLDVLSPEDRLRVGKSVRDILAFALKRFVAGELGERELLAVTTAVNDCLSAMFRGSGYETFAADAKRAIDERVAQLSGCR